MIHSFLIHDRTLVSVPLRANLQSKIKNELVEREETT